MFETERNIVAEAFSSRGWQVIRLTPDEAGAVGVRPGSHILCGDDGDQSDNAPHVLGATTGVAAHIKDDCIWRRYQVALEKIDGSGYLPGDHGDNHHGDLDGCALRRAWTNGLLGLPILSRSMAWAIKLSHDIHHYRLHRYHKANVLSLNFEPDSTKKPGGETYVHDVNYLLKLGFKMEEILNLVMPVAELILPDKGNRRLVIF